VKPATNKRSAGRTGIGAVRPPLTLTPTFLGTSRAAMDAQGGPAHGQFFRARRLPLTPAPQPESSVPAAARGNLRGAIKSVGRAVWFCPGEASGTSLVTVPDRRVGSSRSRERGAD